jgi:hypothetical protein
MPEPSRYEQQAWTDLVARRQRPTRRVADVVERGAGDAARTIATAAKSVSDRVPAIRRGAESLARAGAQVRDAVPLETRKVAGEWVGSAARSVGGVATRVSRVGLTPESVVKKHQQKGHAVTRLIDVRELDLEQVDEIRHRNLDLYYATSAAVVGSASALVMTGGEVGVASGVGSAPGAATVAAAIAGDMLAVLGLASRAVGQLALTYGYDAERPEEKIFVQAVVNFGTATSAAAKEAAFADLVRLTQMLVRGAPWTKLSQSALTRVAQQVASRLGVRFTKKSLGKLIPVVGVGVGFSMNWATLERVVDAADVAYRRRFLLAKYPDLVESVDVAWDSDVDPATDGDEPISIFDHLDRELAGGDEPDDDAGIPPR